MADDEGEFDPRAAELDGLRIRQIALARRSAYRARSCAFIGAFACIVVVAQLIYLIVTQLQTAGLTVYALAYALMIPLCGLASIYCFGRAKRYLIEAAATRLFEPSKDPDFTPLSDGSQRWKDLENIQ